MQGESRASTAAAVFLSYASQDAEAAHRICEALRAAGIEVWFDQTELRGGETWDRRIRQQIHDSRLFIAVISANTEARDEGYFRREWKLAVDRTHDMADKKAFLVPVVIDGTRPRGASVPEKFHELQWTRLPGGETSPAFVEHVRRLLVPETDSFAAAAPPAPPTVSKSTPLQPPPGRSKAVLITGVVLAVALAWLAVDRLTRHPSPPSQPAPKLTDKRTVVLGEITNGTGDPVFDATPRQIMMGELEKSSYLSTLSDARVQQTLRLMVKTPNTKLTSEVASEICERTASAAVMDGSITSLGSKYVLSLRARNCATGDVLDEEQASAAKKEDVFQVLAQMTEHLGTRAASLPRVEKAPGLAVDATTPSFEAWRSYSAAMRTFEGKAETAETISLLKRAIEIDPNFAIAYAYLAREYADLGEPEIAAQNLTKAYELRNRVSDRENYFITFTYQRQVTRNLELARQTLESWVQKYPNELNAHGFLSGFTSPGSGHYEQALEEGRKVIDLDPNFAIGYGNVAWVYVYLNRPEEAEALLQKASQRKIEVIQFSLVRYAIAFLRGDEAAMAREAAARQAKLNAQGLFEHQEALTLAYEGRLKEAAQLSDRAINLARQAGLPERAAQFAGVRAVWNALYGIRTEAGKDAASALSLFRGRDADYGPAFALAVLGDSAQARKIEVNLEKRYPEDTSVQFSYLPSLRALEALNQGDPAKALEMTQAAALYELAVPATAYFTGSFFGALYPVYVRGQAYSRLGRHTEAAAEFQKILDHPGLVLNDPIGPLARLQLARALSASGDRSKSAAVYKDLLAIWKGADLEIPVLKQARAEYANLREHAAHQVSRVRGMSLADPIQLALASCTRPALSPLLRSW